MMNDGEADLSQLKHLKIAAPPDTIIRLHRRLRLLQLGRDLVERQAFAFWIILDHLLRWVFVRRS